MSLASIVRPASLAGCGALSILTMLPNVGCAQSYGSTSSYYQPYSARYERRPLDGSTRTATKSRPAIWEGLYAGVHGGYSTGSLSDRSSNASVGMTGGALGAHVGYNAQFGSFVFGLEGDGTWSNTDGNGTFAGPVSLYTQQDWQSSLRLRAGYALGNWLFYATGGAALTGIDATLSSPGLSLRASDTYLGYAAGGGIEYKMSESVSARVEALHYGYGDKSLRFSTGSLPIDIDTTVVRAGLTFQFR